MKTAPLRSHASQLSLSSLVGSSYKGPKAAAGGRREVRSKATTNCPSTQETCSVGLGAVLVDIARSYAVRHSLNRGSALLDFCSVTDAPNEIVNAA
jgi:hypothetical protein